MYCNDNLCKVIVVKICQDNIVNTFVHYHESLGNPQKAVVSLGVSQCLSGKKFELSL